MRRCALFIASLNRLGIDMISKAPWIAKRYMGKADSWFVRCSENKPVCGSGSGPVVEANAKLIAAAPELLEAAQMGVIWLTAALNCTSWIWDGDQREAAEIELAKMNAAIAEATQ